MKLFKKKIETIVTHDWLFAIQWYDTKNIVNYEVIIPTMHDALVFIKGKLHALGKEYGKDYGIVNIMEV